MGKVGFIQPIFLIHVNNCYFLFGFVKCKGRQSAAFTSTSNTTDCFRVVAAEETSPCVVAESESDDFVGVMVGCGSFCQLVTLSGVVWLVVFVVADDVDVIMVVLEVSVVVIGGAIVRKIANGVSLG